MPPAPSLAILVLAAGRSRRMGQDKMMLTGHDGVPLLAHRIDAALASGHRVFVALPDDAPDRLSIVQTTDAVPLLCPNAARGMGHSLSDAVAQMPGNLDGVMILLADMPAITSHDIQQICAAFDPDTILRGGTSDHTPGHPVLIPATFLDRLRGLQGDRGAQSVLAGVPTRVIPMPNQHATFDVDTADDWHQWQRQTSQL